MRGTVDRATVLLLTGGLAITLTVLILAVARTTGQDEVDDAERRAFMRGCMHYAAEVVEMEMSLEYCQEQADRQLPLERP